MTTESIAKDLSGRVISVGDLVTASNGVEVYTVKSLLSGGIVSIDRVEEKSFGPLFASANTLQVLVCNLCGGKLQVRLISVDGSFAEVPDRIRCTTCKLRLMTQWDPYEEETPP